MVVLGVANMVINVFSGQRYQRICYCENQFENGLPQSILVCDARPSQLKTEVFANISDAWPIFQ